MLLLSNRGCQAFSHGGNKSLQPAAFRRFLDLHKRKSFGRWSPHDKLNEADPIFYSLIYPPIQLLKYSTDTFSSPTPYSNRKQIHSKFQVKKSAQHGYIKNIYIKPKTKTRRNQEIKGGEKTKHLLAPLSEYIETEHPLLGFDNVFEDHNLLFGVRQQIRGFGFLHQVLQRNVGFLGGAPHQGGEINRLLARLRHDLVNWSESAVDR